MGTYDIYHESRERGVVHGERLSPGTGLTLIREQSHAILELMTADGFDGHTADVVVRKAGYIDGVASALEGRI